MNLFFPMTYKYGEWKFSYDFRENEIKIILNRLKLKNHKLKKLKLKKSEILCSNLKLETSELEETYNQREIWLDLSDGQNTFFYKDKREFWSKDSKFHLLWINSTKPWPKIKVNLFNFS